MPTTIGHEHERQHGRRFRVRGRDRRVRRSGGLQRDHGRLWRCVGHRDPRALRGVGAPGPRRARAADQVDRRRGDVRIPRPGNRASGARTPASGVPIRATDSADQDRAQPRPGTPQGERSLWSRRSTSRHASPRWRLRGSCWRPRPSPTSRPHPESLRGTSGRSRCDRLPTTFRSMPSNWRRHSIPRGSIRCARCTRRTRRTAGPRRRNHGSVRNAAPRPIDGRRRPILAKGRLRTCA